MLSDLADFKVDLAGDPNHPVHLAVQGTSGANLVVLLLDGIRVSSPTSEPLSMMANYPVHNARQVEIVYGPASALYGADAFSAVINIISKDVTESAGLAVALPASSASTTRGVLWRQDGREREPDALGAASLREYGDQRAARRFRRPCKHCYETLQLAVNTFPGLPGTASPILASPCAL